MRRFYRGLFIVWVALRYGLDELVLTSFQKPWLRVVARVVSVGRNLDAPRGQRLREALHRVVAEVALHTPPWACRPGRDRRC